MYLEHFGLGVNPFSLSPKLDFLYKSGTFEESMAHLVYGLDNHEAIVLITGAIGTGKTMALQSFLTSLGPRFEFALITNTRVTAKELLKLILEDLGIGLPIGADKSDLLILFKDYLHGASREGKMVLLVVDEAQNLAPEVLEEIRLLTNLGQGESQPVQIILVGQPELEQTVNRPDLAQIRQRIRVHYNLDPLTRQETEEYINQRMAVAGCSRNVFTSGAVDLIFKASHGVPRLVNTLAGEALLTAFVAGHEMVQPGDIDEGQELRFATGPVPVQAPPPPPPVYHQPVAPVPPPPAPPIPAPATPPPPAPAPVPEPPQMARGPQYQQPEPTVYDRHRSGGRGARALRSWLIGAAVILALWALYHYGAVDSLVGAFHSLTQGEVVPAQVSETAVAVQQPAGLPAEDPANNPAAETKVQSTDEKAGVQVTEPTKEPETVPVNIPVQDSAGKPESSTLNAADDQKAEEEEEKEIVPEEKPVLPPPAVVAKPAQTREPATSEVQNPAQGAAPSNEGGIYIHIYSFRTPERADAFVRHWENPEDNLQVIVQEVRGVTWHRIYLGPYNTRADALLVALRLKQNETIDYFKVVTLPSNQGS